MKKTFVMVLALVATSVSVAQQNTLTSKEHRQGWVLLFDGATLNGWKSQKTGEEPKSGWVVEDGSLTIEPNSKGGDIVTKEKFESFDLCFDFKLTKGANSGVKYFIGEGADGKISNIGCEFQVLDDDVHPDAKLGRNGSRKCASLYDIIPAPERKAIDKYGWNSGRVVVKGNKVTHYLNDKKMVEYLRGDEQWRDMVSKSKFKDAKNFGMTTPCYILLQDHNDKVMFRNIKIKRLN